MYSKPPIVTALNFTTTAALNTDTARVLLAAPGAGLSYRIIGINMGQNSTATGVIWVRNIAGGLQISTNPGAPFGWILLPEPGILWGPNIDLVGTDRASVASQNYGITIVYFIDETT